MKADVWATFYERICEDFNFDPQEDLKCARSLSAILGPRSRKSLELVRDKFPDTVLICGGGDGLADELSSLDIRWFVVAADAATTTLLEAGINANMIVTDLDGVVEDQIDMNARGVPVFVHAHGNNQVAIARYAKRFTGPVVGTCQCPPPENIFNFGGFTDGDRAACICADLGARTIKLAGFDFENPSAKQGKSREIKRRKLRWAKTIFEQLEKDGVRVTSASEVHRDG